MTEDRTMVLKYLVINSLRRLMLFYPLPIPCSLIYHFLTTFFTKSPYRFCSSVPGISYFLLCHHLAPFFFFPLPSNSPFFLQWRHSTLFDSVGYPLDNRVQYGTFVADSPPAPHLSQRPRL